MIFHRVSWKIGSKGQFKVSELYSHLRSHGVFPQKFMCKLKIPLKVKVFVWLTITNRILTKDNLLKRGWTCNNQCHFCNCDEIVDHLLFQYSLDRLVWRIVICALGLFRSPCGVEDLLDSWLTQFPPGQRKLALYGSAAVCWTIWKTRNDACFNNKKIPNNPADVVYSLCALVNGWAILQKNQGRGKLKN